MDQRSEPWTQAFRRRGLPTQQAAQEAFSAEEIQVSVKAEHLGKTENIVVLICYSEGAECHTHCLQC